MNKVSNRKMSKEWCKQKSESMKGKNNPFFGKQHSEESKKKMSESRTGLFSGEKNPMYGKKGKDNPNFGRINSEETKQKIGLANKGRKRPDLSERNRLNNMDKHPRWKHDDKLSYDGIHYRMKLLLEKPEFCEMCHIKPPFDLANKSGTYQVDTNDWYYLCRSCHALTDERVYNIRPERRINTSIIDCKEGIDAQNL